MVEAFRFQPGWEYNGDRIAAANNAMAAAGLTVQFDADRPQLKGWWSKRKSLGITKVLAQDSECKVLGKWRDTNIQFRGTCVEQGHSRGFEDTHTARVASRSIVGVYTLIAGEVAYAAERREHFGSTHKWGCTCQNCPDGLMGADLASFYSIHGVLARRVYKLKDGTTVDLSKPREDLAITWNNEGVPAELIDASGEHKAIAHSSPSWEDYSDAVASEHYGAICLPKIFTGTKKDKFGCCEPDGSGGHCTECCGVLALPTGETAFVIQQ